MLLSGSRDGAKPVVAVVLAFGFVVTWSGFARAGEGVVTAQETVVRSAPFEVAPELTRLRAGDKVVADDRPTGTWRRVRLPDGRMGLLHDADIQVAASAAAAAGDPPPQAPAPVVAAAAPSPRSETGGSLAGVMLALMPVGTVSLNAPGGSSSADATIATAVSAFIDFEAAPNVTIGLSPQVIFHVKPDGATGESATEYDIRGRLTGRGAVAPNVSMYGRFSPGYSIIDLPNGTSDATASVGNPKGLVLDFSVGTEIAVVPKLCLVLDLGYQIGFQSTTLNVLGTSTDIDFKSRFLHLGAGLAVRM